MLSFLPRTAEALVERALATMPVVVLMGARQTGKSTLARIPPRADRRSYVTLDDFDVLEQARTSPSDLVRRAPLLTLDEVQREPAVLLAVKAAVDEDRPRCPGRFLLTGSANLLLMAGVSETLAGRATYVPLWPLTRREQLGLGTAGIWSELLATSPEHWLDLVGSQAAPYEDWSALALRGGYPTPAVELEDRAGRELWYDGYVRTYLERDLQMLASVDNLVDFRRLMRAACLRLGGLLNQTDLARDVGLPRQTASRYLSLLETSYQLIRLEPYSVNRTKRLAKTPKLYWSDTGLAAHLAGVTELTGSYLENLVLGDLTAWRDASEARAEILFWRTHSGEEVDFLIEVGGRLLPIEVKAAGRVTPRDARHLQTFRAEYGEAVLGGLVLYGGEKVFWLAEGILAVPWWKVI
ncbi:MAG: ATP-binding protein [Gemmatimonadetes bacterium]|nr:ATP-binding protein [Gemmatimonadota bacterium]